MILDSEEQRVFLLHLIDGVPVQGNVAQVLPFANKVQNIKNLIVEANIEIYQDCQTALNDVV